MGLGLGLGLGLESGLGCGFGCGLGLARLLDPVEEVVGAVAVIAGGQLGGHLVWRRYRGDIGEVQGRDRGDIGEM